MGGKSSSSVEEFGNKSKATHEVRIQYCGGWGYRKHAVKAKDSLVSAFGEKLLIVFNKDSGVTGNLNISIGKTGSKDFSTIHSKKKGDGLVNDDNESAFVEKVRAAMK